MSGESNQVKWVGIRPTNPPETIPVSQAARGIYPNPPNATRVNATSAAAGNTTIVYTVPANHVLFIFAAVYMGSNVSTTNTLGGSLAVRDTSDVHQFYLLNFSVVAESTYALTATYPVAIEVPAGWDVYNYSNGADFHTRGIIHGWLEAA